jgi:hypothetical protein
MAEQEAKDLCGQSNFGLGRKIKDQGQHLPCAERQNPI